MEFFLQETYMITAKYLRKKLESSSGLLKKITDIKKCKIESD